MPRPSPQTTRVVAVIELLAERDGGATMTEIARALRVNQASCVHLLAALAAAGFLYREPADRRYHLGPALARPGRLAAQRYPLLVAARVEMAALSAQFGCPCFAFAPEEPHARLVHYTWPPGQEPPPVAVGETVPLTPPLGMVFAAWAPEPGFARWLALAPDLPGAQAAWLREQAAAVRRLGFVAELAPPPEDHPGLAGALDDRASPYRDRRFHRLLSGEGGEDFLLTDLAGPEPRRVTAVGAPAFAGGGAVALSLSLVLLATPLPAAEVAGIGRAVRAAADRLTAAVGGAPPP